MVYHLHTAVSNDSLVVPMPLSSPRYRIPKRSEIIKRAKTQQQSRSHHPAGVGAAPELGSECNYRRVGGIAAWSVLFLLLYLRWRCSYRHRRLHTSNSPQGYPTEKRKCQAKMETSINEGTKKRGKRDERERGKPVQQEPAYTRW